MPPGPPGGYTLDFYNVSDPHVVVPTEANSWRLSKDAVDVLRDTLERCEAAKPDFILLSGDVAEGKFEGRKNTHLAFETLSRLKTPWYVVPGNHDARYTKKDVTTDGYTKAEFFTIFEGHGPDGKRGYWKQDVPGKKVTLIGLDTGIEGSSSGKLDAEQLAWLDATLAGLPSDRLAILVMHHPIALFNPAILDEDKKGILSIFLLTNAAEARKVVERHREKVLLVISGHTHTPEYRLVKGIPYVSTPSINTWPNRFTRYKLDASGLSWEHLPISRADLIDEAWKNLAAKSAFRDALKSEDALRAYFLHGPLQGRLDFKP